MTGRASNRFHDQDEQSADIVQLRALHVGMDLAVAASLWLERFGLGPRLPLTKQGERFTINESARHAILDRLLALNNQRYEEEVRAGLREKKAKGKGFGSRSRKNAAKIETSFSQSGFF